MTGKTWIISLVLISAITTVNAQKVLSGHIVNENGDAISSATVRAQLSGNKSDTYLFGISDKNGFFSLRFLFMIDTIVLEISCVGYEKETLVVPLCLQQECTINIKLRKDSKKLPEVLIKIDPPIKISGDSVLFNVDYFKKGNEQNIRQLFDNLPGFSINNGKVFFEGKLVTKILVENDDLHGNNYQSLIENLSIRGVEKIEVLKRFRNPEDITTKLSGSEEQVVNIKYSKKLIQKVFGQFSLKAGYPFKYGEHDMQALFLSKKTKAVNLTNYIQ